MSDTAYTPLEDQVLRHLLAGEHPYLEILRRQFGASRVTSREMTGAGFFVDISVSPNVAQIPMTKRIVFGDVLARIDGIRHGAGFLLYVENGCLSMLEGYTYDEPWPADTENFSVYYIDGARNMEKIRDYFNDDEGIN